MASGKRKSFKGHDPYNPKDLPILTRARGDWPAKVGHKHLQQLVAYWFAEHGQYEVPPELVDKALRYVFAAVRYFVDRDRQVILKGMGRWWRKPMPGRPGVHRVTGAVRPARPYVDVKWRASADWVDDLTFARYQRPRRTSGLKRARQRYYLRKLAEQGLLKPTIPDHVLAKLGLTRAELLAAIDARRTGPVVVTGRPSEELPLE